MSKLLVTCALLTSFAFVAWADDGLVTLPSPYSVAETMDRFEATVRTAQPPIQVFARIDYQTLPATQGGQVRPAQLLIFGRGAVSNVLLPQYPRVAIDLPLKILAWEDMHGKVWLTYNTGAYLAQRHGISGKDDLMKRITDFVDGMAQSAAQ